MALTEELARRDWWFEELGVRQTDIYGAWIVDNEGDSGVSEERGNDPESTRLLSNLRLAMSRGNRVAEFRLHEALVSYYEKKKNWKTAAEHVRVLHRQAAAAAAAGQDQHIIDLSSFNNFDNRLRHGCILVEAEDFDEAQRIYDKLISDVLDTCGSREEAIDKTHFIPGKTWAWLVKESSTWDIITQAKLSANVDSKIRERWPES
ncbi:hypothetical protein ASPTUDRAFT_36799 [Aspergillus tubingensis CBS 134.48]|uniref:Uncharacterized protein n=1 Tax=Aspergillus tubingensis (strain CBS 134.48) TaxID=767770 RepID=A0A1L9NLT8_ASPTC|nr:hypothetical protein ASPTUDRAFT_36799 [Aspergillus tubingensis CBS 134.48]